MSTSPDDRDQDPLRVSSSAGDALVDDDAASTTGAATASEQTPLLRTENTQPPASEPAPHSFPSKPFRYKVTLLCALFIFIVDLSNFLMDAPYQNILEDVICYIHFPDHQLSSPTGGGGHGGDKRCKSPNVQETMAAVKSFTMIPEFLFPLLVQIPFGRLADLHGRRPVLRLAILGVALAITASTLVLALPQYLSVWLLIPSTLFLLLGGGTSMVGAMVYTIMADVHPPGDRASVFYMLMALALILAAVLTPLAAWLMDYTPWLPMWLGFGACWAGAFCSLLLPETSAILLARKRQPPLDDQQPPPAAAALVDPADQEEQADTKITWSLRSAIRIPRILFSSRRIFVLSVLTALHLPFAIGMLSYGLQYTSARFSYSWSSAAYIASIARATSVVTLLVLLPLATRLLSSSHFGGGGGADRGETDPFRRDLILLRGSALLLCAGTFLFGLAPSKAVLVASQIVFGLSTGYVAQARVLVTSLVGPDALATLNTALAVLEAVMAVVAAPAIGWLLARGLAIGGGLAGLPYLVLGAVAGIAAVTTFFLRAPARTSEAAET